jgi:hypothetical protein
MKPNDGYQMYHTGKLLWKSHEWETQIGMTGGCREFFTRTESDYMRYKATNGEEWASVVNEAKVLRGPYSQGVHT